MVASNLACHLIAKIYCQNKSNSVLFAQIIKTSSGRLRYSMQNKILSHPGLQHSQDIVRICSPLKQMNISYFAHVNVNNDGEFSALSNNAAFTEHYLNAEYYNADIHLAGSNKFGRYIIWDMIERCGLSEKMHIDASQFGVRHTFTIIKENPHGKDYYHFATHKPGRSINQVYLANLDLLEIFIEYFKETIHQSKQLVSAYDLKFDIDLNAKGYTVKEASVLNKLQKSRQLFQNSLHAVNQKEYFDATSLISPDSFLVSNREWECLQWLIRGKNAPEIAQLLEISKRTVEKHLSNVKTKLGCETLFELGYKLHDILNKN